MNHMDVVYWYASIIFKGKVATQIKIPFLFFYFAIVYHYNQEVYSFINISYL